MGLKPITIATPDDCARFQEEALKLRKDWRVRYGDSARSKKRRKERGPAEFISPNTVVKWSVALKAAFNRANINAGKQCIRGVVPPSKLLTSNPWVQFQWIEGREEEIRQFNEEELLAVLGLFEQNWPLITVAAAAIKTFVWSYARRLEVAGLSWNAVRLVGDEVHFDIVGKWGVRKWFRIPAGLHQELESLRCDSPFVFGRFADQLRQHHESGPRPQHASRVMEEFKPANFGDWLYNKIADFSDSVLAEAACLHVFRKTSLQYARRGEDVNRQVAADARVTEGVMMTNYVTEQDEELRHKSNRTFYRIAASLSEEVARRFGHTEVIADPLSEKLRRAIDEQNWELVHRLSGELAKRKSQAG